MVPQASFAPAPAPGERALRREGDLAAVAGRTALGMGVAALLVTAAAAAFAGSSPAPVVTAMLLVAATTSAACALTGWVTSRLAAAERLRGFEREALVEELQQTLFQFEDRLLALEAARAAEGPGLERRREGDGVAAPTLRAK